MNGIVRIGNAQGFWGDRGSAATDMLSREPSLDFLTLDYLAEVSLSIMAVQRDRDPDAGYARDFVVVVRSLADYWKRGGRCRVITNAGGLNPQACAQACAAALAQAGCPPLTIAVVSGDDVLDRLQAESPSDPLRFSNLDSGHPLAEVRDRLITANAYLGAEPIVSALRQGADLVITGRVADPSLTVAPCIHHFGWSATDWDRLAGATVAGHLIECGTQVTGGINTDWLAMPQSENLGFPIVEVFEDGSCVVTKPEGTGGCVDERTVKEQLVYEIGDPDNYLSPDVTVSFLSLNVEEVGANRVRVSGARGRPAPTTLKVSATFRDGYRAAGTLTIFGRDAVAKARRAGEIVLHRVRDAGFDLRDAVVECLGTGACVPSVPSSINESELLETVLRIAVEAENPLAVERFCTELMPLVTAGPQGTTGYAEGRPHPHPVFRYWPCLIDRAAVQPVVELMGSASSRGQRMMTADSEPAATTTLETSPRPHEPQRSESPPRRVGDLAYARSGDKGTSANIGLIARTAADFQTLCTQVTADRVADFFEPVGLRDVIRYELPNLLAINFVAKGILSRPLRIDAQGKTLGQALLEMPLSP